MQSGRLNISEFQKLVQNRQLSTKVVSINDLREKEYGGKRLSEEERKALSNYEEFRIAELNRHINDAEFNKVYQLLQVMANLRPYQDFL